jgi:serine/threonine-protein kinase
VKKGTPVTVTISKGIQKVKVPNLKGMKQEDAEAVLKDAGLKAKIEESYDDEVEEGLVISQSKKAGKKVRPGTSVVITVSLGTEPAASYSPAPKTHKKKSSIGGTIKTEEEDWDPEEDSGSSGDDSQEGSGDSGDNPENLEPPADDGGGSDSGDSPGTTTPENN